MNKKGQVSIEYLMIIGAVFVVIVPLFYYTMAQTSENLRLSQMTDAIETLSIKANSVCSLAQGTTLYADITVPSGIIYTNVTKNIINAKTSRFGDIYKNTICEVNGTLPSRKGNYRLPITKLLTGIVYIGNMSLETVLASCTNRQRDGDESDIDCGGSCKKCDDGKRCNSASDCLSGYCSASNLCFTPAQTYPVILLEQPTPANETVLVVNSTFINSTITDPEGIESALLWWNGVNESLLQIGNNFYKNKTKLSDGTYNFKIYATDYQHLQSVTATRTITVNAEVICEELFGNAVQNSGAINPTNALLIDGNYAILPNSNNWVRTLGFTSQQGQIKSVQLAMRYKRVGTYTNDRIRFRYYIGTTASSVYQYYYDAAADITVYFDVTASRTWSWADISNLRVFAQYNAVGSVDALDWYIDALWVRVCHTS